MRRPLIIFFLISIVTGCGGSENVLNLRFPTLISLNKEKNALAVGDPYEGKVNIIDLAANKRLKDFSYDAPLNIAVYESGFLIFLQKGNTIRTHEIMVDEGKLEEIEREGIDGILTGLSENSKDVWLSVYRDGKTKLYLYPEQKIEIPSLCSISGVINETIFLACSDNVLKIIEGEVERNYQVGEANFVFPDPISDTVIIVEGRDVKMLDRENGRIVDLISLSAPVLSFIPFSENWIFLDALGYARIVRRSNGCEIKHSTYQITDSSGNLNLENIMVNDCTAITAEWKLEYEGELPHFPRIGRIVDKDTIEDRTVDLTTLHLREGYKLILSGNGEGEFTIVSFDAHTINILGEFPDYNIEVTYSVRVNGILLTKNGEFLKAGIHPGETVSMPEITFTISGSSPQRGDYLTLYSYEYGENMPFFVNKYPVSVTFSSEEEVYILNPQGRSVSEVDFKNLKVKRTIK